MGRMKPTRLLLTASLAANAVLLGCFVWREAVPERADAAREVNGRQQDRVRPASSTTEVHDFATVTPSALRDRLRQLGLPKAAIDALVRARIYSAYEARRRELVAAAMQSLPWWRTTSVRYDPLTALTVDQRKELRELEAAARSAALNLLGPAALDRDGAIARRYSFLPPDKAVLVDALERDYRDLGAELKEDTRNVRTAADRAQEKFLEAEHQRDLAALLTPAEREAFDLRASPAAEHLSLRMAAFQPTEEEYRALFAIQRSFDEKYPPGTMLPGGNGPVSPFPTTATLQNVPEIQQQIRGALSDARFADWQLSGQFFFQSLALEAPSLGVTFETVKQVAVLLTDTSASSWRIGDDRTLSPEQKKQAIIDLAAATGEQVTAMLGAAASETLLTRTVRWFPSIAAGAAVKVDGNNTSTRSFSPAPARPAMPGASSPPSPPPRG
jgi:hypothetical protein